MRIGLWVRVLVLVCVGDSGLVLVLVLCWYCVGVFFVVGVFCSLLMLLLFLDKKGAVHSM